MTAPAPRRLGRALLATAFTVALLAGVALTTADEAEAAGLPDVSPSQVAAVVANDGSVLVLARGYPMGGQLA